MSWSPQQEEALAAVKKWLTDPKAPQVFRLFGFAGTGKTTLAKEIQHMVKGRVLYATFTGKAALVLRSKGCHAASTIHSLIYKPIESAHGITKFVLNHESELMNAALLCVDEVSMVGEEIGVDLLSFGKKILVLGDPFQLPPIRGAGFFTAQEPNYMLTEIHRQARDNPIIALSMKVREGMALEYGDFGESKIITRNQLETEMVLKADQLLVGLNRTRQSYNTRMRDLRGFTGPTPVIDERLVCLRNNREKGLLNGGIWKVKETPMAPDKDKTHAYGQSPVTTLTVSSEDTPTTTEVKVPDFFFSGQEDRLDKWFRRNHDEFTFGYALTVHKSQGSQWPEIVLFDESQAFREHQRRWLYTGITRAAERITIIQ